MLGAKQHSHFTSSDCQVTYITNRVIFSIHFSNLLPIRQVQFAIDLIWPSARLHNEHKTPLILPVSWSWSIHLCVFDLSFVNSISQIPQFLTVSNSFNFKIVFCNFLSGHGLKMANQCGMFFELGSSFFLANLSATFTT